MNSRSSKNKTLSTSVRGTSSSTKTSSPLGTDTSSAMGHVQELETNIDKVEDMLRTLAGGLTRIKSGIPEIKESLENNQEKTSLKMLKEEFKNKSVETTRQIGELQEEKKRLEDEIDRQIKVIAKKDTDLDKISTKLQKTEKDLSATQTRLSEVMGNRLIDKNPDIADLSDQNRPSKLAEKYSELYDNEWTDAFEAIQSNQNCDELECVKHLLKILKRVSKFCSEKWDAYITTFRRDIRRGQEFDVPDYINKQLKDIAKSFAPRMVEDIYQEFTQTVTARWILSLDAVTLYIKCCVEICWLMAAQDPPVVFKTVFKQHDSFDTNIFKAYTQNGVKIDFLVWPPMYLQDGGALLSKGVAQAIKMRRPESAPASNRRHKKDTDKPVSPTEKRTPGSAWETISETPTVTRQPQGPNPMDTDDTEMHRNYRQTSANAGLQGHTWMVSNTASNGNLNMQQTDMNMAYQQGRSNQGWQEGQVGQLQANYNQTFDVATLNQPNQNFGQMQQNPNQQSPYLYPQHLQQPQVQPAEHILWNHPSLPKKSDWDNFYEYSFIKHYSQQFVERFLGKEKYILCRDYAIYTEKIVNAGGKLPTLRN